MNTSQFMDKQIMDLSAEGGGGSSPSQSKIDFIDFMKTQDDHHHVGGGSGGGGGGGGNGNVNNKKDEILPNYDFQPIRHAGFSSQSPNLDGVNAGGGSRVWNSADSKADTTTGIRNYGSMDSIEPAKVILEKDCNVPDAAIVSEIDRTMKKHADNLLHALEGISARLTQLESRTRHLENSVDDLQLSVGNNHGSTDGKMRQLENILREVHTGVQVVRDNQEKVEAQLQLAKMQMPKIDQHPDTQNTGQVDNVQQTVSAPQPYLQQLPPAVGLPSSHIPHPPPNAPPPPPPPHNLPPQVQVPNQYPQNQIPSLPQREPYFQPPGQAQEASNQQYYLPPTQQPQQLPPPAASHQQYQPALQAQYSQPPQPPQQLQSLSPTNPPPQPQPSLSHHSEEMPYPPSQSYPPSLRQPPSQPTSGAPPSQQFYGPPSHMYEPPSGRSNSGFSSGYGPQTGPNEPYSYSGSAPQYGGSSTMKPQQLPSAMSQGGGSGYPQLPTARILPQASPTASGATSGSGSAGTGNRVPIDDVVDKVTSMGFPRDVVRATVRKLTENGQSVDLNIVLDKLMNDGDVQPPKGWFGR